MTFTATLHDDIRCDIDNTIASLARTVILDDADDAICELEAICDAIIPHRTDLRPADILTIIHLTKMIKHDDANSMIHDALGDAPGA